MNSLIHRSKWLVLALPLASPNCGGSGGGGTGPSKTWSPSDWTSFDVSNWLPSAAIDTLHQLPLIGWFV